MPVAVAENYLNALNAAQRRAVEHGVTPDGHVGSPLLVIAGAGSGKTNTLAHRVAHLIVSGADPRRILLMTFSRRAAAEMAARGAHRAQGDGRQGRRHDRRADLGRHLSRHRRAAAARVCRADRARSRLHDPRPRGFRRPDESGPARARALEDRKPLSRPRARASRSIRAASTPRPTSTRCWAGFPWCAGWDSRAEGRCSPPMSRPSRRQNVLDYDDLLLYWAQMMSDAGNRRRHRRPLRSRAGRRVSGHQPAAGLDPAGAEARRARADRGRRRCAVDLLVPRRDGAQHPRLSRTSSRRARRSSRSTATTARRSRSSRPPTP